MAIEIFGANRVIKTEKQVYQLINNLKSTLKKKESESDNRPFPPTLTKLKNYERVGGAHTSVEPNPTLVASHCEYNYIFCEQPFRNINFSF